MDSSYQHTICRWYLLCRLPSLMFPQSTVFFENYSNLFWHLSIFSKYVVWLLCGPRITVFPNVWPLHCFHNCKYSLCTCFLTFTVSLLFSTRFHIQFHILKVIHVLPFWPVMDLFGHKALSYGCPNNHFKNWSGRIPFHMKLLNMRITVLVNSIACSLAGNFFIK